MNTYLYKAFGLNIQSEIMAADWLCDNSTFVGEPDLYIKLGSIDNIIPNYNANVNKSRSVTRLDDKIVLTLKNIVNYLILDAQNIVLEPLPNYEPKIAQATLFSSIIGILLQKKGFLTVHGCGIVHNGGVYIFVGDCGVGKSSLALTFVQQGCKLAADDFCAIQTHANSLATIYPSYPHVKLSTPSATKLNIEIAGLNVIHPMVKKYFYPLENHWYSESLPVKHICILETWKNTAFNLQRLYGIDKIVQLKRHMHSYLDALNSHSYSAMDFKHTTELIANTPASIIKRPDSGFLLFELAEFIKNNIMR